MFRNKCFLNFVFVLIVAVFEVETGFQTTKLGPHPIWNATFTDQLRRDLLLNYDKFARPAQHYNVTNVKLGMEIKHIELNEFKSTLTVYSWLRMVWDDDKLKWDPNKYGGIQHLNLADHELWQPDIFLYNSATATPVSHYNTHCLVYYNGNVLWVPPTQFSVLCNLNFKYWPFDSHTCTMKFGSWTYHGEQINIDVYTDGGNSSDVKVTTPIDNNQWQVTETSIFRNVTYYDCCTEPYPDINVVIQIKRISPSYKTLIVSPSLVVILMTLLTFWLPPSASGEKIILNGCATIIIFRNMMYFIQKLPFMGNHTPLIVTFYSDCLYISLLSMMISVTVICISRTRHTTAIPWFIKQHLRGKIGWILGLQSDHHQGMFTSHSITTGDRERDIQVTDFDDIAPSEDGGIVKSAESTKSRLQDEWILLATAIDRTCFIIFAVLYALLAIIYSV